MYKNKKIGFTLAEVLITLTIVGVIAALTIPNLIHQHKQKEYEARFNKAYSTLSQGLTQMVAEQGGGIWDKYVRAALVTGKPYYDFASPFYGYFKTDCDNLAIDKYQSKVEVRGRTYNKNRWNIKAGKTYNNATNASWLGYAPDTKVIINEYFSIYIDINFSTMIIFIDTNTFLNPPNRLGYDLFLFTIKRDKDQLVSADGVWGIAGICSPSDNTALNGFGCTKWAMINKCPYDNSKTYWECLK